MSTAFVIISCDVGQEKRVADQIKSLIPVTEVQETIGAYDIVAKLESNSANKIKETVSAKIQNMNNVRSTLTLFMN